MYSSKTFNIPIPIDVQKNLYRYFVEILIEKELYKKPHKDIEMIHYDLIPLLSNKFNLKQSETRQCLTFVSFLGALYSMKYCYSLNPNVTKDQLKRVFLSSEDDRLHLYNNFGGYIKGIMDYFEHLDMDVRNAGRNKIIEIQQAKQIHTFSRELLDDPQELFKLSVETDTLNHIVTLIQAIHGSAKKFEYKNKDRIIKDALETVQKYEVLSRHPQYLKSTIENLYSLYEKNKDQFDCFKTYKGLYIGAWLIHIGNDDSQIQILYNNPEIVSIIQQLKDYKIKKSQRFYKKILGNYVPLEGMIENNSNAIPEQRMEEVSQQQNIPQNTEMIIEQPRPVIQQSPRRSVEDEISVIAFAHDLKSRAKNTDAITKLQQLANHTRYSWRQKSFFIGAYVAYVRFQNNEKAFIKYIHEESITTPLVARKLFQHFQKKLGTVSVDTIHYTLIRDHIIATQDIFNSIDTDISSVEANISSREYVKHTTPITKNDIKIHDRTLHSHALSAIIYAYICYISLTGERTEQNFRDTYQKKINPTLARKLFRVIDDAYHKQTHCYGIWEQICEDIFTHNALNSGVLKRQHTSNNPIAAISNSIKIEAPRASMQVEAIAVPQQPVRHNPVPQINVKIEEGTESSLQEYKIKKRARPVDAEPAIKPLLKPRNGIEDGEIITKSGESKTKKLKIDDDKYHKLNESDKKHHSSHKSSHSDRRKDDRDKHSHHSEKRSESYAEYVRKHQASSHSKFKHK